MVRFHGDVKPKDQNSKITDVDQEALDGVWRLVAAMKQEGIYTRSAPTGARTKNRQKSWGVPEPGTGNCGGLVFFDEGPGGLQGWMKAIYTPTTPTPGPLADDPAVAIIQIQNEDGMLFWTMQGVKGGPWRAGAAVRGLAEGEVGCLEKTPAAWHSDTTRPTTSPTASSGMKIVWDFTQAAAGQVAADRA